jgi:hypothetical protein
LLSTIGWLLVPGVPGQGLLAGDQGLLLDEFKTSQVELLLLTEECSGLLPRNGKQLLVLHVMCQPLRFGMAQARHVGRSENHSSGDLLVQSTRGVRVLVWADTLARTPLGMRQYNQFIAVGQ